MNQKDMFIQMNLFITLTLQYMALTHASLLHNLKYKVRKFWHAIFPKSNSRTVRHNYTYPKDIVLKY